MSAIAMSRTQMGWAESMKIAMLDELAGDGPTLDHVHEEKDARGLPQMRYPDERDELHCAAGCRRRIRISLIAPAIV